MLFVIQMENVKYLHPNDRTDPDFGAALREAAGQGVRILAVACHVSEDTLEISGSVPVHL